jgi:replicative DNA helicase
MNFNQPNLDEMDKKVNSVLDPESQIVSIWDAANLYLLDQSPDVFPVGFEVFSKIMKGGFRENDLVVISGKTGHGKTTFAQTLSYHFNKQTIPQLWFSYEVDVVELREKFQNMGLNQEFIGYCPMKIKSGNVEWIEERIREGITKFNIKAVFIDHLGFLTPQDMGRRDYTQNLSAYLGQITRQLKNIARENHIVIFLLTHTKKTKDTAEMDDIANSGGIAQEADSVFLVERERAMIGRKISDQEQGEILGPYTRISLTKNRRTGITKFIKCQLLNGKLAEITNHYGTIEMS